MITQALKEYRELIGASEEDYTKKPYERQSFNPTTSIREMIDNIPTDYTLLYKVDNITRLPQRRKHTCNLPPKYLSLLKSAAKRSIKFDLSLDEFNMIISKRCSYCGSSGNVTAIRLDTSASYYFDNLTSCCHDCALMKNMFDSNDFITQVTKIARHMSLR